MIREAKVEDARDLVPLMEDLGYPTSEKQMENRMKKIVEKNDFQTFVWEGKGGLKGMIGMSYSEAYHTDDSHVRIIAFVVKTSEQGNGIGRRLMGKAEQWAEETGAKTIMLNSGNREERQDTHDIYRHFGYEGKATGFYKTL